MAHSTAMAMSLPVILRHPNILYIGTYNNAGNKSTQACGSGNYFYCKCWNANGELVRDYRPVVRVADNASGFYDVVTQTFIAKE